MPPEYDNCRFPYKEEKKVTKPMHVKLGRADLDSYKLYKIGNEKFSLKKEETKEVPQELKKSIVINTAINTDKMPAQKSLSTRSHQKAVLIKQVPKCLNGPRHFIFSESIFNVGSPTSENRVYLVSQFLIQKIGQLKFDQINSFLSKSPDPIKSLQTEKEKILTILGSENEELISVLKYLISKNDTNTIHSRHKSVLTPTNIPRYLTPQNNIGVRTESAAPIFVSPVNSEITSTSSISPLSIEIKKA